MNGTQQYASPVNGGGQFDPQGFIGSLLGGIAGGVAGKAIGGSTGQSAGRWAGRAAGAFLPFDAGPTAETPPTELEMLGFWNVMKKIGKGVGTGIAVGKTLGVFDAGTPGMQGMQSGAAPAAEAPSEIEMLGFWSVLKKIGKGVGTGVDIGKQLGVFDAGVPGMQSAQTAQAEAPSEIEMLGFWSVLKKIGKGVGTGIDIGKQIGVFDAGVPNMQAAAGAQAEAPPSDLEMLGFWSVLKKIGKGASTTVNLGKQLGVFDAGVPGAGQQAAGQQAAGGSQEDIASLIRQALPALQALAQQQSAQQPGMR
ncbi:MAG: hypothetical protein V4617_05295 [Gemmatimonadota bacterium]